MTETQVDVLLFTSFTRVTLTVDSVSSFLSFWIDFGTCQWKVGSRRGLFWSSPESVTSADANSRSAVIHDPPVIVAVILRTTWTRWLSRRMKCEMSPTCIQTENSCIIFGELKPADESKYSLCHLEPWWLASRLLGRKSQCSRWWVIHWWWENKITVISSCVTSHFYCNTFSTGGESLGLFLGRGENTTNARVDINEVNV